MSKVMLTCILLFLSGIGVAEENTEIFIKDIEKQKEGIVGDLNKIDEALIKTKLQEARSKCDLVEFKLGRIKKDLSKKEIGEFRQKVDNIRKIIPVKEDSLIAKAIELMHTKGVDASLHYAESDLRMDGVPEKKILALESKILKDAPAIQLSYEREEIARVVKILESGELPDSSVTPYIIKSAQIMVKTKKDSIRRVDGVKKFRDMETQEREDRIAAQPKMIDKKMDSEEPFLPEQKKQDAIVPEPQMSPIKRDESTYDTVETKQTISQRKNSDKDKFSLNNETQSTEQSTLPPDQPTSTLVQNHLQMLKNQHHDAQEKVMELYGLLEKNKGIEALDLFKRNRDSIAQCVDAQVFTILEQTIMQTVIQSQSKDSSNTSEIFTSKGKSLSTDNDAVSSEKEHLNRINGFLRDNKIEAAYTEFKRSEKQLKQVMEKNEFKQFKKMIENAYKTRHPEK